MSFLEVGSCILFRRCRNAGTRHQPAIDYSNIAKPNCSLENPMGLMHDNGCIGAILSNKISLYLCMLFAYNFLLSLCYNCWNYLLLLLLPCHLYHRDYLCFFGWHFLEVLRNCFERSTSRGFQLEYRNSFLFWTSRPNIQNTNILSQLTRVSDMSKGRMHCK